MREPPLPAQKQRALPASFNGSFSLSVHVPVTNPTLNCASADRGATESVMRKLVLKFLADQSGATAIEYCLIAAGISIVIVVAVNGIGTTLNGSFASVNASIK